MRVRGRNVGLRDASATFANRAFSFARIENSAKTAVESRFADKQPAASANPMFRRTG